MFDCDYPWEFVMISYYTIMIAGKITIQDNDGY